MIMCSVFYKWMCLPKAELKTKIQPNGSSAVVWLSSLEKHLITLAVLTFTVFFSRGKDCGDLLNRFQKKVYFFSDGCTFFPTCIFFSKRFTSLTHSNSEREKNTLFFLTHSIFGEKCHKCNFLQDIKNTAEVISGRASKFFSSKSSWRPKTQPHDRKASIWLSFWFSTRPSADTVTH